MRAKEWRFFFFANLVQNLCDGCPVLQFLQQAGFDGDLRNFDIAYGRKENEFTDEDDWYYALLGFKKSLHDSMWFKKPLFERLADLEVDGHKTISVGDKPGYWGGLVLQ